MSISSTVWKQGKHKQSLQIIMRKPTLQINLEEHLPQQVLLPFK